MNRELINQRLRDALDPALVWYRQREPREQLVLRLLGATLLIALVWFLLVSPLKHARDQAQQRWVAAEQTRQWIEANQSAVQAAQQQSGTSNPGGDWVGNLNATAAEYQVTLKGFTPEGDDSVRVLLEDQPFSNVLAWLQALEQNTGVSASSIEFSEGSREGAVNVRATLERGL